ncbi:MAG: InlB B-repeat-containing protein, partial [Lachnospiraceae bacterium]|nr:InlB B-repeat-containing protein [Lachnospiraceae bacterium]
NTKANGTGDAYLCGETVNSLVSKNNGSITLYAQWSADEHVITYINTEDADNTANPDKCTVESKISLKAPKKEGYTFEGWYENSAFEGKKISSLSKVTEDKDLFAKWSENKYKVAFNKNGGKITAGSLPAASEYLYTANVELPDETVATLERYGYTLTGFNTKANGTGIHYDLGSTESSMTSVNRQTVTLYAEWTIDEYDVNYILDGGTNNAANPDHHTAVSVVTLKNPVKEGYTFAGWYTDEDFTAANKVTKINKSEDEVTLYAKWTENVYKISYNKNGGNIVSGNLPPTSDYIPYTEEVDIPDSETVILERYGYTLTGYNTKANGTGTHFDLGSTVSGIASANKKTVTLYAEWTVDKYDVDYNLDGGINNEANTDYHTAVSDLVLKNPVKTGYTFKGWFKDSDYSAAGKITKVVRSEEAATVYAKWQVNSYSVIFNRNGGTGAMASLKENYDVTYDLPANAFTRNGYRFVEWNTKANGTGTGYANEESVSNLVSQNGGRITLYAIWEKD